MGQIIQQTKASDDSNLLVEIPRIRQAIFFLEHASQAKGIKITDREFLNRDFVRTYWETFLKSEEDPFRPSKELECPQLSRVRFVLEELSYIKKNKNFLELTDIGRQVLKNKNFKTAYKDMIRVDYLHWDWTYGDRLPEITDFHKAVPYLIEHLKDLDDLITPRAFYLSMFKNASLPTEKELSDDIGVYFDPQHMVAVVIEVRFFERFCVPFGILEKPTRRRKLRDLDQPYKITQFFRQNQNTLFSADGLSSFTSVY